MPTREESRKKRERICVICGAQFLVAKTDRKGASCSRPCLSKMLRQRQLGKKASEETKAKRSVAVKTVRNDPERKAEWDAAIRAGIMKHLADPNNRAAASARSSAHMRKMHTDPEFQKRRDERSSNVMKAVWVNHREKLTQLAVERYARGEACNSEEGRHNSAIAAKWIMKKAQEALRVETDYNERYAEIQARLRREMPYDGPLDSSDYYDYLRKLGKAVTSHPELRKLSDAFIREAIPRFSAEWLKKREEQDAGSSRL
jgi:hypothetical protein